MSGLIVWDHVDPRKQSELALTSSLAWNLNPSRPGTSTASCCGRFALTQRMHEFTQQNPPAPTRLGFGPPSPSPEPFLPMAMAALSCLTPLAGRHATACLAFFRHTAALHSPPAAAAGARFSSNSDSVLRSSWRVRGDEERLNGAGTRRTIVVKAADQGAIDSPLMSSMTTKVRSNSITSLVFLFLDWCLCAVKSSLVLGIVLWD